MFIMIIIYCILIIIIIIYTTTCNKLHLKSANDVSFNNCFLTAIQMLSNESNMPFGTVVCLEKYNKNELIVSEEAIATLNDN